MIQYNNELIVGMLFGLGIFIGLLLYMVFQILEKTK